SGSASLGGKVASADSRPRIRTMSNASNSASAIATYIIAGPRRARLAMQAHRAPATRLAVLAGASSCERLQGGGGGRGATRSLEARADPLRRLAKARLVEDAAHRGAQLVGADPAELDAQPRAGGDDLVGDDRLVVFDRRDHE